MRLHVGFLVLAAFVLHVATSVPHGGLLWYGLAAVGLFLSSVVLHELAHAWAAHWSDGRFEEVVIGPFGGLTQPKIPYDPLGALVCALAGPVANLGLCGMSWLALRNIDPNVGFYFHPLAPPYVSALTSINCPWGSLLELLIWINGLIALVNLLPAFPLDGGPLLRAALSWSLPAPRAHVWTARVGAATGLFMVAGAWWLAASPFRSAVLPMVTLGLVLFFWNRNEVQAASAQVPIFELDQETGWLNAPEPAPTPSRNTFRDWIESRRERRRQQLAAQEALDDQRMDDVLARLHESGLSSLTEDERALLQRVSVRYRQRLNG